MLLPRLSHSLCPFPSKGSSVPSPSPRAHRHKAYLGEQVPQQVHVGCRAEAGEQPLHQMLPLVIVLVVVGSGRRIESENALMLCARHEGEAASGGLCDGISAQGQGRQVSDLGGGRSMVGLQCPHWALAAPDPRDFHCLLSALVASSSLRSTGGQGSIRRGSMVGNDRLNVPAIDTFRH